MAILQTFLLILYIIPVMVSSLIGLTFHSLLTILGTKKQALTYMRILATMYARFILLCGGTRVSVSGRENIPSQEGICIVSNHQGYMDIFVLAGYTGKTIGFIAKYELTKIPVLYEWMKHLRCVFINRQSLRDSFKAIQTGIKQLRDGYNMAIFPEGTRSRSSKMRPFKKGSLKLATKAKAPILPVTIQNSFQIFEERNLLRPAKVYITYHPVVTTAGMDEEQQSKLVDSLWNTINAPLNE